MRLAKARMRTEKGVLSATMATGSGPPKLTVPCAALRQPASRIGWLRLPHSLVALDGMPDLGSS